MFFDNHYHPPIIGGKSIEDLEDELQVLVRPYPLSTPSEEWAYYAYLRGIKAGLSEMYSVSFGSYISSFMSDMGVDAGTDIYFKHDIDEAVFNIYEAAYKSSDDDESRVRTFFDVLLIFYQIDAHQYEKAVFHHTIHVSEQLHEWFSSHGISYTVRTLLYVNQKENTPLFEKGDKVLSFKLTYSQEELWLRLDGDSDVDKLESLLKG